MSYRLRRPLLRFVPEVVRLETRDVPAVTHWLGNIMGKPLTWSEDINWSNGKPGPGDTAKFAATFMGNPVASQASTMDVDFTIGGIESDNTYQGTLTLAAHLTTTGTTSLSCNGFPLAMVLSSTGTWTNSGAVDLGDMRLSISGTVINSGTWTMGKTVDVPFNDAKSFLNNAGAKWIFPGTGSLQTGITTDVVFTNKGVIEVTGTGTLPFEPELNNEGGTIEIKSGNMNWVNGGQCKDGTLNVAMGSTLQIGSFDKATLSGTFTGSGGGTILWDRPMSAGTGLTMNFPAGMVKMAGGSARLTAGTLTNIGFVNFTSGTIDGATVFINQNQVTQSGGLTLSNGAAIDNQLGATWDVQGDGDLPFSGTPRPTFANGGLFRKSTGTLTSDLAIDFNNVGGTIEVNSGTLSMNNNGISTNGTITVAPGATLNLGIGSTPTYQGKFTGAGTGKINWAASISAGTGCIFDFAEGSLQMTTGGLTGGTLTNQGHLTIAAGIISAGATLANDDAVLQTGTFSLQSGAAIDNNAGGVWTVTGNVNVAAIGSPEPVVTNKGTWRKTTATGTAFVQGFRNLAGGIIDVQTGILDLRSAQTSTGGTFQVATGATLDIATTNVPTFDGIYTGSGGGIVLWNAPLIAGPTSTFNFPPDMFRWSGGTLNGGTLTNSGNISLGSGLLTTGSKFINQGTVSHQALPGAFELDQQTGAEIFNDTTGLWDIQINQGIRWITGATPPVVTNNGLFRKSGGTGVSAVGGTWNNAGTIEVMTGTLRSGATVGSVLVDQGGIIDVAGGAAFDLTGNLDLISGILRGHGKVSDPINNSGGSVRPGSSPGTLTVSNNYTQSGTGSLLIELNGDTAGLFDQLAVTGKVTLGGELKVNLGYAPVVGHKFVIIDNDLTDAVTTTFNALPEGGTFSVAGTFFSISYKGGTGNDVELTVVNPPVTPPQVKTVTVNDGLMQRSLVTNVKVEFTQVVGFAGAAADAFTMNRQGDNAAVLLDAAVDNSGSGTVVTLTFTGGAIDTPIGKVAPFSLSDGRYTMTIDATKVSSGSGQLDGNNDNMPGGNYQVIGAPGQAPGLFRLFGDADGNGTVAAADFNAFRLVYGAAGPSIFDFNGDNQVTASDFNEFRLRYGTSLTP